MENPELDDYCWAILIGLAKKGSSSFNKLCEMFSKNNEELGFSFATPTVIRHLRHLEEAGYVKHKKEGSQKIIYSVNLNKINEIEPLKMFWDRLKNIADSIRPDINKFFSLPENEQLPIVLDMLLIRKLSEIKAQVELQLDKSFEKRLAVAFWNHSLLKLYEEGIVRKCVKDEIYRKKIFKEIDEWLNKKL